MIFEDILFSSFLFLSFFRSLFVLLLYAKKAAQKISAARAINSGAAAAATAADTVDCS